MRCFDNIKPSNAPETEPNVSTSTISLSKSSSWLPSAKLIKESLNQETSTKLSICEKFETNFQPSDPKQGKNFERLTVKPSKNLKTHQKNSFDIPKSVKAAKVSEMKHRTSILNFGCQLEEFFIQRKFLSMNFQKLKRLQKTISNMDQKQLKSFELDMKSKKFGYP